MRHISDDDFKIIERVAKQYGFFIHPPKGEDWPYVSITNDKDEHSSAFWWQEYDGTFESFFEDVQEYFTDAGYKTGSSR